MAGVPVVLAAIFQLAVHAAPAELPSSALWSTASEGAFAPSGGAAERRVKARELFAAADYLRAAEEFESLAREGGARATEDWFNAATARVALQHDTHVLTYLERVLADASLQPRQRAQAEALQASARQRLLPLGVSIDLPRVESSAIVVKAAFLPVYASDRRPPLEWRLQHDPTAKFRRSATLRLDAGEWQISVTDPRFLAESARVRLTAGRGDTIAWALRPLWDRTRARRFAGAFAGVGLATAVAGVGLLATGQSRWVRTLDLRVESCGEHDALTRCRTRLAQAGNLRIAGGALLGVGVGGAIAGLTALVKDSKRRRRAWISEAVVGAASVIGGAVLTDRGRAGFHAVHPTAQDEQLAWTDTRYVDGSRRGAAMAQVGAAWAGLGGGLVFGAVVGLLADRAGRFHVRDARGAPSVRGSLSPGHAGLRLSGRF